MSTRPPVSSQISWPVVCSWIAGLAGLSNCCGIQAVGRGGGQFLGPGDRPPHAVLGRREYQVGPERPQQGPPLQAHRLGHGERQPVALGRGHERQGDARVAAGGLDDVRLAD